MHEVFESIWEYWPGSWSISLWCRAVCQQVYSVTREGNETINSQWSQISLCSLFMTHIEATSEHMFRDECKETYKGESKADNCNLYDVWGHSLFSWFSFSCLHPIIWPISCYLNQSEDRGCSIALHNSLLIYFALSFIHLLGWMGQDP